MGKVIFGKPEVIRYCVVALLSGEHILLEDVPGVGKTLAGKAIAKSIGLCNGPGDGQVHGYGLGRGHGRSHGRGNGHGRLLTSWPRPEAFDRANAIAKATA